MAGKITFALLALAVFASAPYAIDLIVVCQPEQAACFGTAYNVSGDANNISASPNFGYVFHSWGVVGGYCGIADPYSASTQVSMGSASCTVAGSFLYLPPSIFNLTVSASEGGSAGSSVRNLKPGAVLPIAAIANGGHYFAGWQVVSGNCQIADSGTRRTTVKMGAGNCDVAAQFNPNPTYSLTVFCSPKMGSCGSSRTGLREGNVAPIAAIANNGYYFLGWVVSSGGCYVQNPQAKRSVVTMGSHDCSVMALFGKDLKKVW